MGVVRVFCPRKLFNEQEMGVVRYYCGLISKLFNEQEIGVVG